MTSLPAPQQNRHEAIELHDCGHYTRHPCLNPEKGNEKTHECTFRIPVELHGAGVRRLCPTCTFAQATKDENNPGTVKKWWKDDLYAQYMTESVQEPTTLARSNAIMPRVPRMASRPGTPLVRSASIRPDIPLFGMPPTRDGTPASEKEAKKDEGKETEAKKPSRMASVKNSIKRFLSVKKKPIKKEEEEYIEKRKLRQRSLSRKSIKYTASQLEDMRRAAGGEDGFD